MHLCSRCILPDTFSTIQFDDAGVCNHCRQEEKGVEESSAKKEKYRQRLDELVRKVKGEAPSYDVIMAYSGGKDSSYTLKMLKERYDLRILAITFDNHFIAPVAWDNIRKIADHLAIDQVNFRYPWPYMKELFRVTFQKDIFPASALLRASSICTACISIVKGLVLKTALEMSIPLAAFGWSPGQAPIQSAIMKTIPASIFQNQAVLRKAFPSLGRYHNPYPFFLPDKYYEDFKDRFPHNIHPLAFFDYDENKIKSQLEGLGWKAPSDTDTNSTNCLLNALANENHIQRHRFHPYVQEIANMVRRGVMSREEGIEKIYTPQNPEMVRYARERLDL
jgi:tRNA(Ile)-lysidine synthase TilS/MesJ